MIDESAVIGQAAAQVVREMFESLSPNSESPALRLKGLDREEIASLLVELDGLCLAGHSVPVSIVVGSKNPEIGIPASFLLAESGDGSSITWYRNRNHHGLVVIELHEQSDSAGMGAFRLISDSDLLGATEAHKVFKQRSKQLIELAWRQATDSVPRDVNDTLVTALFDVLEVINTRHSIPLRLWVSFVAASVAQVAAVHQAMSGTDIRALLGDNLGHAGLFPDRELFEAPQWANRLQRNLFISELKTPSGSDVNDEDLGGRIDSFVLTDASGLPKPLDEIAEMRREMHDVLETGGPSSETTITFETWERLFTKKATAGLGTAIRVAIETDHPHRIADFDELEVHDRLDEGDPVAADLLLKVESQPDEPALVDLLPATLRKKLDRLVYQQERIESDPLLALLYGLHALGPADDDPTKSGSPRVRLETDRADGVGAGSAQLFAFLYGQTLANICDICDGAIGYTFEVAPELLTIGDLPALFTSSSDATDTDDAEDERRRLWAPLRLKVTTQEGQAPLIRFRWDPESLQGLVAFARLVCDHHAGGPEEIETLEKWWATALDNLPGFLGSTLDRSPSVSGPVRDWRDLRTESLARWTIEGICADSLDEFLVSWSTILQTARETYVPSGGALVGLDEFLEQDTLRTRSGGMVMLPTHPLRLRWLRHHLENVGRAIERALNGNLTLNSQNDKLYFDWIEATSAHRQPPIAALGNQQLAAAVRETCWHEEFAPVSGNPTIQIDQDETDDVSISELVATARAFLNAFPHKLNGLTVLLAVPSGAARAARRFVDGLRHRDLADLDLELHVVTRIEEHDQITAALAGLESDIGRGRVLMPRFRLVLHHWDGPVPTALKGLRGRVDIVLAPNLFGRHSIALEETRRNDAGIGGQFDPWIDSTTHFRPPGAGSINVSQIQLPESPDPVLEAWSTLSVRRYRQSPVSTDNSTATDFITLQVSFDENEPLFHELHRVANWVVTLDRFVGRDQIDALNAAPDVIVVKTGVGKNESYTLVVSSTSGRQWVEARLKRRLVTDFEIETERADSIACRLYEIGRHVVPGLMLRAVGLGRTTEEVLGLILARFAIGQLLPTENSQNGFEIWISLDDHTNWFGGPAHTRPDLLRVEFSRIGDTTSLAMTVVESKFRQQIDLGTALQQVNAGRALFEEAMLPRPQDLDDGRFWRRELCAAIGELSRRDTDECDLPAISNLMGRQHLLDTLTADLISGNFKLLPVKRVICATGWAATGIPQAMTSDHDGLSTIRLDQAHCRSIIELIENGEEPGMPGQLLTTPSGEPPQGTPQPIHIIQHDTQSIAAAQQDEPAKELIAEVQDPFHDETDQPGPTRRGLTSEELEARYGRILERLDQHGVDVDRGINDLPQQGPGFCLYRVIPRRGVSTDRVMSRLDDLKLALELPAELSIRTYVDRGAVVFEVPKEDGDRYFVDTQSLWGRTKDHPESLVVPLGEDISGDIVNLNFSSSDTPHLLIAGQTGSGKSIALETILEGLTRRKTPDALKLLLVDPKSTELIDFESDPHLHGEIGWTPEDAIEKLEEAVHEMNRRYPLFRQHRARTLAEFNNAVSPEDRLPWWLIVLDEYADLTSDAGDRKRVEVELKRVSQKGRAAGIHLIVATQKPSAEVISTVIRSNLPSQLALRVKSSTDSRIILGESGAESLAGKGDAFLRTEKGMVRVQCGMVRR